MSASVDALRALLERDVTTPDRFLVVAGPKEATPEVVRVATEYGYEVLTDWAAPPGKLYLIDHKYAERFADEVTGQ